ncbi:hypothetical protein [Massilia aerilata]
MTMQTIDDAVKPENTPRKRGRPSTGKALSDADRQARRREKLKTVGKALLPPAVVSQEVEQALAKFIQFKDMTLGDALDRIVRDRLLRKRSGKRKRKEQTHG